MMRIFRNLRTRLLSKFIRRKKRAGGMIMTMILVFIFVTFSVIIGEYYRMHILQQDIEYQLQRSVNCAVEYAMGDSYRQDKIINLNIDLAKQEFYKYLGDDVGLDSDNQKYKNSKLQYTIYFTSVDGTSNPASFVVVGYASAKSIFPFLTSGIRIPFKISSTNFRID